MYSFTLNKKAYFIPSAASELTLGQFVNIKALEPDDELGLLTILMGEEPQANVTNERDAKQLGKQLQNTYALIDMLAKDLQHCLSSGVLLVVPKRFEVLGLTIEVKEDLMRSLPYWGYVHTREVILSKQGMNEEFDATNDIAEIIAHNLYCLVTKNAYNEAKAEEFKEVILQCNFIQCMQLGNFFLIQQKRLWTSRRKRWIMRLNLWRLKLVSKFSANTERPTPWKHYPEGISFDGKRLRV